MPSFLSDTFSYTFSILRDHNWMLVIFTGLLVVFTALLAIFTRRLWLDAKILQRAYIAVEPLGIHMMINGSDLNGHVGIKNAGHLPASKLSWFINIKFSGSGEESEEFFPLERGNGNIVIAPGTTVTRGSDKHIEVQKLNDASRAEGAGGKTMEKRVFLYVWGAVEYDDGFKQMRTTKFCHRYNWINRGRGNVTKYEISAEYARYHDRGNGAN
jgi:hypothetical protein